MIRQGPTRPTPPSPTRYETLVLEYINRCRANPAEDAVRCIENPGSVPYGIPAYVDRKMFQPEMSEAKPVPPLVFNLALLKAARWHSYYQVFNGMTHSEDAGKKGFTASSSRDRLHLVGIICRALKPPARTSSAPTRKPANKQPANLWASHLLLVSMGRPT